MLTFVERDSFSAPLRSFFAHLARPYRPEQASKPVSALRGSGFACGAPAHIGSSAHCAGSDGSDRPFATLEPSNVSTTEFSLKRRRGATEKESFSFCSLPLTASRQKRGARGASEASGARPPFLPAGRKENEQNKKISFSGCPPAPGNTGPLGLRLQHTNTPPLF